MKRTLRRNRFGRAVALLGFATLWAGALDAQTSLQKFQEQQAKRSAFDVSTVNLSGSSDADFTLNVNNWLCGLRSDGSICTNTFGSTTGGGGFWPIGTTNQYVFLAGLQVAARDPLDPAGFVASHCFNVSATNAQCGALDGIFHSDVQEDLNNWPATCQLANPQTGELVKTLSQLDTCARYWDGNPSFTVPGGHPMGIEMIQHTLTFTLEGFKDMIFFIFKVKNISNTALFQDANPSLAVPADGWTLEDMYVAVGHDADVSANDVNENFGTFVPFLNDTTPLFIGTIWLGDFAADDFEPYAQCGFCSVPGFVGTTFLRSPYNNTGDTITTNTAGVIRVVPPIEQETLEELRELAAFGDLAAQDSLRIHEIGQSFGSNTTRGGVFPDPTDASQSWRYYSGNLNPAEQSQVAGAPPGFGFVDQPSVADTRYYHATGPFDLPPGDSVEIVVGLVGGAPVLNVPGFVPGNLVPHGVPGDTARIIEKIMGRGVENTAYPSLFKQVLDARNLFDNNFLLPSPPPAPIVTAIPGDMQNTITWSSDPVDARDPFADIAENFGLGDVFEPQDFQGFRVYRKVRAADPWSLIAQFDLADGLGAEIVTTDSVQVVDSSFLAVRADTADFCVPAQPELVGQEPVACTVDTGLAFSLVDRGGQFPNPANGPGLINGVTYFYAVTSFDLNTPFAPGGSSLESGRRLSASPQAAGGAAATPRSTASNLIAGTNTGAVLLGDDSRVADPGDYPSLDEATGLFAAPMPATDGLVVNVDQFGLGLIAEEQELVLTIDSVVPGNVIRGGGPTYYMTVAGPGGSSQIVLPATMGSSDGEVANTTRASFVAPLLLDPDKVEGIGGTLASTAVGASVDVSVHDGWYGTLVGRGYVNGHTTAWNGPRWRSGAAEFVEDPNEGMGRWWCWAAGPLSTPVVNNDTIYGCDHVSNGHLAGEIAGWDIVPTKAYTTQTSRMRSMEDMLSSVRRVADIQVTWGANGAVESVIDLTHQIDVPFSAAYRASYGFLTLESFDGVDEASTGDEDNSLITPSDWTCVSPQNEFNAAGASDHVDCVAVPGAQLQPAAALVPIDTAYFGGSDAGPDDGFAMYLNGELTFFLGPLPNAGDVWVMQTYSGYIDAEQEATELTADGDLADQTANTEFHCLDENDMPKPGFRCDVVQLPTELGAYTFAEPGVRPPAAPGLRYSVILDPDAAGVASSDDLSRVHTVPNPFRASSALQASSSDRKIQFINLPTQATIRIFTLSGVLVDAIEHDAAGSGTANWDLRNRNNQFVASGVYFYHVSTPTGAEKVGRMTIIQAPNN